MVVLGYGDEPWLAECLTSVLNQQPHQCVLVDNGITSALNIAANPALEVVTPASNLGFAGGCNEGVRHCTGDVVVFVNSDAVIQPGALRALTEVLTDDSVGLVTASIRLGDRPDVINAAGNPMHWLGYTWAGGMGDLASAHENATDVTCVSGATFAVRRDVWNQLGGFDDEYFAYGEDVDLSIRCWQAGLSVVFEPRAVSWHHYEFGRNPDKWFLLERGRLINVLTLYERRTRRFVFPMLVAVEAGSLIPAAAQGWGRSKVAAWRWLWSHRDYLHARSVRIAAARVRPDADLLPKLVPEVRPPAEFGQKVPEVANAILGRYWRWSMKRLVPPPVPSPR